MVGRMQTHALQLTTPIYSENRVKLRRKQAVVLKVGPVALASAGNLLEKQIRGGLQHSVFSPGHQVILMLFQVQLLKERKSWVWNQKTQILSRASPISCVTTGRSYTSEYSRPSVPVEDWFQEPPHRYQNSWMLKSIR